MPTLTNWRVRRTGDRYTAPELTVPYLSGDVTGHPKLGDGAVDTSEIVGWSGRTVTTIGGTVYTLGDPDPAFAAWCMENGKPIDPDAPVKIGRAL